ncbi:MAG: PAS domain S-box protein, partial [Acidobacteriota bacterium]
MAQPPIPQDDHQEARDEVRQQSELTEQILSEQPRSGEEWTEEEQNFRELVETVNDIIFSLDGEGKISYISPVIEQITGYHPSEVMGRKFAEFIEPEDLAAVQESFQGTLQGRGEPLEYRVRTKGGQLRWVRSSSRSITRNGEVVGVRGVMADITQQRALEDQMRQAQKMEAVGQLAGGIAHDFNNLLTTILGHCDLMADSLAEHDPMRSGLEEVRKAASTAASLTQQLLAFSRKQRLWMKILNLTAVIRDLELLLARMLGENIGLRTKLPPTLGRIRCDQAQLEQVIIQLVVNARDAMPRGGRLTIEATNVDFPRQQPFRQFVVPAGRYVELSVRDTGSGMDSETLAHIFEPFFTTKEKRHGTGLGLATVYGIVKQSGGYVSADSEPGAGTAFRIYFPRLEEEAKPARGDELGERPGGSETLMVVEDDPGVRSLMCRVLRQAGYAVIEARHPGEALLMC